MQNAVLAMTHGGLRPRNEMAFLYTPKKQLDSNKGSRVRDKIETIISGFLIELIGANFFRSLENSSVVERESDPSPRRDVNQLI